MNSRYGLYCILAIILLSSSFVKGQTALTKETNIQNNYFLDSVLLNFRLASDGKMDNAEAIFIKYYKGLDLIEEIEDSLKLKFYDEYGLIMRHSKLYDESNKLAKKGIQLAKEVTTLPQDIEIGFYYNQLAFNYLDLHKFDSVTWAYKEIIEVNNGNKDLWQNVSTFNNLGYHYFLNLKNNDSALYYLNKLNKNPDREIAFKNSLTLKWSIKDNIALVYMDQGRYNDASALFKEIYEHYGTSQRGYLWRERWFRAGLQYVDVQIKLGNLNIAKQTLLRIENQFNAIPFFENSPVEYFPSKLLFLKTKQKYTRVTGNFKESDYLGEKYLEVKDSINLLENAKLLDDLNLIRNAGLHNAFNTIKREKAFSIIEKENLALDLKSKSTKVYWFISILSLLLIMIIGYFYFKNIRKHNESQNKMQVEYSQNLIKTQEEERRRVARELHDSVGQKLMLLSKTTKDIGNPNAENLASSTLEEVREISRGLHPSNLERLGLTMAINALIYDVNKNTDLFFSEEIEDIDGMVSQEFELHLFRIIQESLNNIVKHSEAKAVTIKVNKTSENLIIKISDNGKGFNFDSNDKKMGLGMKTLFERAKIIDAKLLLKSNIGEGTSLNVSIPYRI